MEKISLHISDSIGSVSAELIQPNDTKAILTLAHGAGANMNHPFMRNLANELATKGIATLRFNFPYMEKKKKLPDPPPVAERTIKAALDKVHELFPDKPVFASGKSFGGRMSTQLAAKECPTYLKGIVLFGFPLHAPGKASTDRAAHLASIKVPMLFLQGTRDALAQLDLINQVVHGLPLASLTIFDGADHSFKAGRKELIPELADKTSTWIKALIH